MATNETKLQIVIDAQNNTASSFKSLSSSLEGFSSSIKTVGAVGAVGFAAVTAEIYKSVDAANYSAGVQAQLTAALTSTHNAAGLYIEDLNDQAKAIERYSTFDDEAVNSAEALLLTFTNIKGAVYQEALPAIVDMSQAMGQDLQSSVIQVGKALNDPIQGISALQRVGVTFSDSQKEVIANLVKTGQTAKAQTMIINELNREFGGSAAAAASTFGGKLKQLNNQIDDMQEEIGGALIPILAKMALKIAPIVQQITDWVDLHPKLTAAILGTAAVVTGLTVAVSGLALAVIAFSAVSWPVVGIMALIVAGLVALAVAAYELYKHWDDLVSEASALWSSFEALLTGVLAGISAAFSDAWQGIEARWNAFSSAVSAAWSSFWATVISIATEYGYFLLGVLLSILDHILPGWQTGLRAILQLWVDTWNMVKAFTIEASQAIGGAISAAFGATSKAVSGVLSVISSVWSAIWGGIKDVFDAVWDAIVGKITEAVGSVAKQVDRLITLFDKAKSLGGSVSKATGSFGDSIYSSVSSFLSGLVDRGKQGVNDGVIQNGQIISTHPDDYIIATKNPSSLAGGGSPITINITGTFMSEDAAERVGDMIMGKLRLSNAF